MPPSTAESTEHTTSPTHFVAIGEIAQELLLLALWAKLKGYPRASQACDYAHALDDYFNKPVKPKRQYRKGIAKAAAALGVSRQTIHAILNQDDGMRIIAGRIRSIAQDKPADIAADMERLADGFERGAEK